MADAKNIRTHEVVAFADGSKIVMHEDGERAWGEAIPSPEKITIVGVDFARERDRTVVLVGERQAHGELAFEPEQHHSFRDAIRVHLERQRAEEDRRAFNKLLFGVEDLALRLPTTKQHWPTGLLFGETRGQRKRRRKKQRNRTR